MKRALIALVAVALSAPAAFAGNGKANTGCGLGTMLFGSSQADDSIVLQILAVTTNGTFGTQTFGISSGTSECEQPASVVKNERLNEFIQANLDNLARDIARGQGETLSTLGELMAVPAADRETFSKKLQAHFVEIFPSSDVQYAHVTDTILRVAAEG